MNRILLWATRLYPPRWRARYGEEFEALIQDAARSSDLCDILYGALIMQFRTGAAFLKFALTLTAAGALIAAAISFNSPRRYESSAIVQIAPAPGDTDDFARYYADTLKQQILSRGNLSALIRQPTLKLYSEDLQRLPLEDVVQQMRNRDIQVQPIAGNRLQISCTYTDKEKARRATQALASQFANGMPGMAQLRASAWERTLHRSDAPPAPQVRVVRSATLPAGSGIPDLALWISLGALAGALAAFTWRRPKPALRFAAFAALGGTLAFGISYLIPAHYTSSARVKIAAGYIPEQLAGFSPLPPRQEFEEIRNDLLGDENLARMVEQFFPDRPFEDARQRLRQAIKIEPANDYRTVEISFTGSDPRKTKQAVDHMVARAMESFVYRAKKQSRGNPALETIREAQLGPHLEVLDPASLPEDPASPDRLLFAAIGAPLGLLLALLVRRRPAAPSLAPALAI